MEEKGGALKVQKHYAAGSTIIAVRTITAEADTLQWMISDHLGSTSTTANSDGTWNSDIRYTAFGEIRLKTGVTATGYRYTGQLDMQGSIGLDYYVARFYDPQLARFAQADTIIPAPGNTLSFDRYAYVHNNPISNNDPTGHVCKQYVGSTCVAYSNDTWTPPIAPPTSPVRSKFSWPPKELTQTMAFQPEFNKETYKSTIQTEYNNCGPWAAGADIPGMSETIQNLVIAYLNPTPNPFILGGKGMQPSLLARAAASVYGGNVWSKNNATVQDILEEIAKGNQVVVDIAIIEYWSADGTQLIGEPGINEDKIASHFARVLGVDLVNNEIYLTNSIGGDAYWTLSLDEFIGVSTDPERRADPQAEGVNQWILVINTGK